MSETYNYTPIQIKDLLSTDQIKASDVFLVAKPNSNYT